MFTKFLGNRLENTDLPIVPPIPDTNLRLYQKWRRLQLKKVTTDFPEIYTVSSTRLRLHLKLI